MTKVRLIVLASLGTGLIACQGAGNWQAKLDAEPLYQRANALRQSPSCRRLVYLEYGHSFPVPSRGSEDRFSVLFYPIIVAPGKSVVVTPAVIGSFAPRAGDETCVALSTANLRALGPAVPSGISGVRYYQVAFALYSSLPRVARLYRKGLKLGSAERKDVQALADAFLGLAEPPLLAEYYRLNPEFWEWLRQNAGRSLPGPARS
jgi:hypothetical protein